MTSTAPRPDLRPDCPAAPDPRRRALIRAAWGAALCGPISSVRAQGRQTSTHVLAQRQVDVGDHANYQYQLFTAVPRRAPPPAGFPVLYMLDGNAVFERMSAADWALADGLVIVGVGYPVSATVDLNARTRDYTPRIDRPATATAAAGMASTSASTAPAAGSSPRDTPGGAAFFRTLLTGPLRAAAERDMLAGVPLDAHRRSLWGHSYGGLFAIYTLLTRPGYFQRYCAISPSSTWSDKLLARMAQETGPSVAPRETTDLLILLGDREARAAQPPAEARANPATLELIDLLGQQRSVRGLRLESDVLHGLNHSATFLASLPRSFALAQA